MTAACLVCLVVAVHPFVTYPLSLLLARAVAGRRAPPGTGAEGAEPTRFSIIFCAFNEQDVLPSKLANMADIRRECPEYSIEVLAFNDGSSDRTLSILQAHEPDVIVIEGGGRSGIGRGQRQLIERASGEIVVFTDANVLLTGDLIRSFARAFRDKEIGVACSHLVYTNSDTATASVGTTYWKLEETIKQLETDTGSTMGADGSAYAIRRALFTPSPPEVAEDFFTSMSILSQGYRVVSCPDAIAYEKSVTQSTQELKRKIRIGCRAWNGHRRLRPALNQMSLWNRYKYVSHKLSRWFTALWLALAVVFASLAVGVQAGWSAGLAVAGGAILGVLLLDWGGRLGVPVVGKVREILLAFAATFYGVIRSVRGERFETWAPAASARE